MREQYVELYKGQDYRAFSPGEHRVPDFLKQVKLTSEDVILDIGCGTGRATKALNKTCKTIGLDFVKAIETDVEFVQHDFRKPFPLEGTVGFCCDVMEHIHPRDVKKVLKNIMKSVDKCYFQICTVPDHFGGGSLHLTVKPFYWWAKQMPGMIRYARQERNHSIFVVQRSFTIREMDKTIKLMEEPEVLKKHIFLNLKEGYEEAVPKEAQATEVALLAGGPSLNEFKGFDGPIITVNGAYNWAIERGYKVSAQIIVDPREWNKRFTQPITDCRYLIGSQCHPEVAKSVPKDKVWLWHSGDMAKEVIEEWSKTDGDKLWYPILGGSTVMLRGLPLLIMLGLRNFHIWGWDSCFEEDHHAYPQPENDDEKIMDILVGGRRFKCHSWMAMQAQEFVDLVKHMLPNDVNLNIHGNGLIAHILNTGASYGGSCMESL